MPRCRRRRHRQDPGINRAGAPPFARRRATRGDPVPDVHQGRGGGNGQPHRRSARRLGAARRCRAAPRIVRAGRAADPAADAACPPFVRARARSARRRLRIQTIHSFAQTLLAAFPAEAGISPVSVRSRGARSSSSRAERWPICCRTPKRAETIADRGCAGVEPAPRRKGCGSLSDALRPRPRRAGQQSAQRRHRSVAAAPDRSSRRRHCRSHRRRAAPTAASTAKSLRGDRPRQPQLGRGDRDGSRESIESFLGQTARRARRQLSI